MIDPILVKPSTINMNSSLSTKIGGTELAEQFGTYLNEALAKVNNQQNEAEAINVKYIKGEVTDIHKVTIAAEKASLGLEMTVQMRNKVIEAYQEIMRTQI